MKVLKDKGVEGKVIVCTGAAGVLCSSMTEDLLRHGAKVAVLDLRGDVARDFCAKLAKKGLGQTLAIEANVLDKASLEAACKAVLKKWKRIDVLINGAGGNHPKGTTPAEQMTKGVKLEDTFFGLTPEGFEFDIKDIVINAGAEMIVAIAGDIIRMPGLPKSPQALRIDVVDGHIDGLS